MLCFDVTMPVSDTLVNDWTWWLNSFFQSCAIIAMVRHFTDEQRASGTSCRKVFRWAQHGPCQADQSCCLLHEEKGQEVPGKPGRNLQRPENLIWWSSPMCFTINTPLQNKHLLNLSRCVPADRNNQERVDVLVLVPFFKTQLALRNFFLVGGAVWHLEIWGGSRGTLTFSEKVYLPADT